MPRPDTDELMRYVRAARNSAKMAQTQRETEQNAGGTQAGEDGSGRPQFQTESIPPKTMENLQPLAPPPGDRPPTPPDLQSGAPIGSDGRPYSDREHRDLPLQAPVNPYPKPRPQLDRGPGELSRTSASSDKPRTSYLGYARNVGLGLGGAAALYYGAGYLRRKISALLAQVNHGVNWTPGQEKRDRAEEAALNEFKEPTPTAPVKVVADEQGEVKVVKSKAVNLQKARMPQFLE